MQRWSYLLIAAIGLAYANTFTVPFLFDDYNAIVENPYIRQLWPPRYLVQAPTESTVAGRPLVGLTLAVNHAISGNHPWSYHAVNLGLHMACALLLFRLASQVTGQRDLAGVIALVWAVHPLLTESVTYVIQRTELLMAFFFLLTLYCLARGWLLGGVAACAAGMASKEVMAVVPVMALLFDRTFLAGSFREAWGQRRAFYLKLAGTWVVFGALWATAPRGATVGLGFRQVTPLSYALTQCDVIAHYLRLSFWPAPLVLDYFDWPMSVHLVSIGLMVGLAGATVWALWAHPRVGFLGAWFVVILAPTSSVVPIVSEVAAERRMYLPLIAVVAGVCWLARWRPVKLGLLVLSGVLLGLTLRRNHDYRSAEAIWRDALEKRPGNVRAQVNLGEALVRTGQTNEALELFHRAVQTEPRYIDAQYNYGVMLAAAGNDQAAVQYLEFAAQREPNNDSFQANYGITLARLGRISEAKQVLLRAPNHSAAQDTLGALLAREGRIGQAIPHFRTAIRLDPGNESARRHLATALREGQAP